MNVLLSIKPKYVEEMVRGRKRYEFRRRVFRRDVKEAWIYATSPVRKIVGTFRVGEIVRDSPMSLWRRFGEFSGVCEREFFDYFRGVEVGFAIRIDSLRVFKAPVDPWEIFADFKPPRCFRYFDESSLNGEGLGFSKGCLSLRGVEQDL